MSARRKSAPKPEETPHTACEWLRNFSATVTIGNNASGALSATLKVRNGEVDVVLSQAIDRDKLSDTIVELVSIARPAVDAIPFPF